MRQPFDWQIAQVVGIKVETARVKTFTLRLPEWMPHQPGQHYDLRLTAEDGYQTQRSYSIASAPERDGEIDLTIERIADGEASTYLHDVVVEGDRVEVRGPIGGYFVWQARTAREPLVLVAGGSGIVPLMSMIRQRQKVSSAVPTRLLFSSRTFEDIIYRQELEAVQQGSPNGLEVFHTLTRAQPPGWTGYARRLDEKMLSELIKPYGKKLDAFLCGPTQLVESAATALYQLGVPPAHIRTERFGPTGGAKGE